MSWTTIWDGPLTVKSLARIQSITAAIHRKTRKGERGECWIWTGTVVKGFGKMTVEGRQLYVHRVAWELANREKIPEGASILRSCSNLTCVNPDHLSLGCQGDIMSSLVARDKWPAAKLTREKVLQIREKLKFMTQKQIAKEEGLNVATIGRIKRRESWKEI